MNMGAICVLTDSSAQFSQTSFAGKENVRILPLEIVSRTTTYDRNKPLNILELPKSANQLLNPSLIQPSRLAIIHLFDSLLMEFDEIIAIFISNQIFPLVECTKRVAQGLPTRNRIHIFDSTSISCGLGDMVERAASMAIEHRTVLEISQMIRKAIPKIYAILFIPAPTYLAKAGIIDLPQAMVSEFLEIFPIYSLEEGKLLPVQKVKGHRSVFDIFQEFLEEFEKLKLVTLIQGNGFSMVEERLLRQYCKDRFKHTNFLKSPLSPSMGVLFGPHSMGLIAIEK